MGGKRVAALTARAAPGATGGAIMDDPTAIRSNIEHYRALLNLYMTDETRQTVERFLAKAKAELDCANAPETQRASE
jgi:hypothetical protein